MSTLQWKPVAASKQQDRASTPSDNAPAGDRWFIFFILFAGLIVGFAFAKWQNGASVASVTSSPSVSAVA